MTVKNKIKKLAVAVLTAAVILSIVPADFCSAAKKKKVSVDLDGKYHASMGIQTATELWMMHLGYYDGSANKYFGTDMADKLVYSDKDTGEDTSAEGTFTDVEIAGNGTYTVKLENVNFNNEQVISQLHIATDIPLNDTIKFTNVKLKINGVELLLFDEGFPENQETYLAGGMVMLLLNHWRPELIKHVSSIGLSESAENGYTLLQGTGGESIEITFTVSGFNYDNPETVEPTEEPTKAPAGTPEATSNNNTDTDTGSSFPVVPVVIVVVVVVAIGAVLVIRNKK